MQHFAVRLFPRWFCNGLTPLGNCQEWMPRLHQDRVYQLRAHAHDVDPGCLTTSEVEVLSPRGLRPQPYFS